MKEALENLIARWRNEADNVPYGRNPEVVQRQCAEQLEMILEEFEEDDQR